MQNGGLAVGPCRSGLYLTEGIIMRLIDDSSECSFLDNRKRRRKNTSP